MRTASNEMTWFRPAVSRMTSSNRGMLPPTKPVFPPCTHYLWRQAPRHMGKVPHTWRLQGLHASEGQSMLTWGTIANRLSLQYARILDTCSVLLGRSASLLFPEYFPIQSLHEGSRYQA